ncbi:ComEA family DNA-binding protein [Heliobacterium chlorum]|uniref:ComEA family DNA-binding protein n=1 Tax=Heliobacterium chlorum TaxID=2698 RepID=A0ABR7T2L3_HELCL|nr:ComEA family DNA-binding protein [Heliobacterium chlorum]MBC9785012.1 ComEA family DNA-binding protein [Heliobacterium chlorum]
MDNRKRLYYILGGLIIALVIGMAIQGTRLYNKSDVEGTKKASTESKVTIDGKGTLSEREGSKEKGQEKEIRVHVSGAVNKPGVYQMPAGSRVDDALRLAEASPNADVEAINRAALLTDGRQLVVPALRSENGSAESLKNGQAAGATTSGGTSRALSKGSSGGSGYAAAIININSADASELDKLPGVGPALAQRILQYRETKGPFQRVEDIQNVPGIGPKKYNDMKEMLSVY